MRTKLSVLAVILFFLAPAASAVPIGGIEFPDGEASFADEVVSYNPGDDVGPGYNDSSAALGVPDYSGADNTAVSLGDGGVLVLRFTDNSLTASGDDTPDLHIFEIGGAVEWMHISISTDGDSWIELGDLRGQPTSIDIDAFAGVEVGTRYSYVKIADDSSFNQTGWPYGEADIDAVGAISSAPPVQPVPEPASLVLLGSGLVGVLGAARRRRI